MKDIHIFSKNNSLEVKVRVQIEIELTYYDVTVQHVNHYITEQFFILMQQKIIRVIFIILKFDIG